MKALLKSVIFVIVNLAHFGCSLNITLSYFTDQPADGDSVNLNMTCDYTMNETTESFSSMNFTKDNRLFYSFDNNTELWNPIPPGVTAIFHDHNRPESLVLPNINKTTNGWYTCTVYTTKGTSAYAQVYFSGQNNVLKIPQVVNYLLLPMAMIMLIFK